MDPTIYCADTGSVTGRNRNFGWARTISTEERIEHGHGGADEIRKLVEMVAADLAPGQPVALGFEFPLFVPVNRNAEHLGSHRPGEVVSGESRPWAASGGACALATGLAQVAWILSELRLCRIEHPVHLEWARFATERRGLFLWEAFVTGAAKRLTHGEDALAAVEAFRSALPEPMCANAVEAERPLSVIGAALLWSGWSTDAALLHTPCLVIKPKPRDARQGSTNAA